MRGALYAPDTDFASQAVAYRDLTADPDAASKWFCPSCEARFGDADFGTISPPCFLQCLADMPKPGAPLPPLLEFKFGTVAELVRAHEDWTAGELLSVSNAQGRCPAIIKGMLMGGMLDIRRLVGAHHWVALGVRVLQPMLTDAQGGDAGALGDVLYRGMQVRAWATARHADDEKFRRSVGVASVYDIMADFTLEALLGYALVMALEKTPKTPGLPRRSAVFRAGGQVIAWVAMVARSKDALPERFCNDAVALQYVAKLALSRC